VIPTVIIAARSSPSKECDFDKCDSVLKSRRSVEAKSSTVVASSTGGVLKHMNMPGRSSEIIETLRKIVSALPSLRWRRICHSFKKGLTMRFTESKLIYLFCLFKAKN